ncbi:MAG: hypothetical protein ABIO70_03275 [Pseudomonadota bacterium]
MLAPALTALALAASVASADVADERTTLGASPLPTEPAEPAATAPPPAPSVVPPEPLSSVVRSSPRWRKGSGLIISGVAAEAAGSSIAIAGAVTMVLTDDLSDPAMVVGAVVVTGGTAVMAYGAGAIPLGFLLQHRALRDAGVVSTLRYLAIAGGGVALAFGNPATSLLPEATIPLGAGVVITGLVLQHKEHWRALEGTPSIRSASLQPWSDGERHGMSLAVTW